MQVLSPLHKLQRMVTLLRRIRSNLLRTPLIPTHVWSRQLCLCHSCQSRLGNRKANHVTPLFLKAEDHLGRSAILDQNGRFTYEDILHHSSVLCKELLKPSSGGSMNGARVALLCANDVSYVVTKWAIWMAGAVAVPLCKSHPASELEYVVSDSQSCTIITTGDYVDLLTPIANKLQVPMRVLDHSEYAGGYEHEENDWFLAGRTEVVGRRRTRGRVKSRYDDMLATNQFKHLPALVVYTSGTTGRPKGVVLTHGNLHAMMTGMVTSWGWRRDDVILHVLPLHHLHGIANVLMTPLYVGALCVMMPGFDPAQVWSKLLNPVTDNVRINIFMAVPTVYAKLIENYDSRINRGRVSRFAAHFVKSVCRERIRLMVSGSSALPETVLERWKQITGHTLLERYGMTEIGMALSNPLHGPRISGFVGRPMPGVEVCIARPNVYAANGYDQLVTGNSRRSVINSRETSPDGETGDLLVRGPSVFSEYWQRDEATSQAFTKDGWFKTGDTAMFRNGVYKIVGRTSVDIIKSGGYKISALDIERVLLGHPDIMDCTVVGLPDITWGQKVAAILLLQPGASLSLEDLRLWAKDHLPAYQLPTVIKCVDVMPRNVMGKVNKKELVYNLFPDNKRTM